MALTTAQQVRLKIQDLPAIVEDTYYGDGTASAFILPHNNLTSGTAMVVGANGWSATAATFDVSGYVTFSGAISANTAFRVRYVQSVFSEDELGHFTAVGGSVLGAASEALESLMFDGIKRARWRGADGNEYDDTAALNYLTRLYDKIQEQLEQDAINSGGFQGWAENQEYY